MPLPYSVHEATAAFRRGRALKRRQQITATSLLVLDAILWVFRRANSECAVVSYREICAQVGCSPTTLSRCLTALENARLLRRQKRRVRIAWLGRCVASRQLVTRYWLPRTDSTAGSVPGEEVCKIDLPVMPRALEAALGRLGKALGLGTADEIRARLTCPCASPG